LADQLRETRSHVGRDVDIVHEHFLCANFLLHWHRRVPRSLGQCRLDSARVTTTVTKRSEKPARPREKAGATAVPCVQKNYPSSDSWT
jgi:hypothetical protein